VVLDGPSSVLAAVQAHESWVAGEVLALELSVGTVDGEAHTVVVDDDAVRVRLDRA
jgi:hypothetical protein